VAKLKVVQRKQTTIHMLVNKIMIHKIVQLVLARCWSTSVLWLCCESSQH